MSVCLEFQSNPLIIFVICVEVFLVGSKLQIVHFAITKATLLAKQSWRG